MGRIMSHMDTTDLITDEGIQNHLLFNDVFALDDSSNIQFNQKKNSIVSTILTILCQHRLNFNKIFIVFCRTTLAMNLHFVQMDTKQNHQQIIRSQIGNQLSSIIYY